MISPPSDAHEGSLRRAARAFIQDAFAVLKEDRVLPTPVFHPYVKVGRDYFGPDIMACATYKELESLLDQTYPERFADPRARRNPEFATTYIFSFLEACIARCASAGVFEPEREPVEDSINELLSVLNASQYEVVCCRVVAHLTTSSGSSVSVGDFEVFPESDERDALLHKIAGEIPGAFAAFNREEPRPYDPPHCLISTRAQSDESDPYDVWRRLSGSVERFLLLVRLLTAGTVQSYYEVTGTSTLISRMSPIMGTFSKGMLDSLVRRTVRITGGEGPAVAKLGELLKTVDVEREGMVATSFDVALDKFNRSHLPNSNFENLVDLATAFEAIMSGGESDNEALTLRLRSRAATLLATNRDLARSIFDDIGLLYALRSKLVHGGHIKEKELRKIVGRISTVPSEAAFGVAVAHAVDRMRDLVRRAILARVFLASDPDPVWPFSNTAPVDALLSEDSTRAAWRRLFQEKVSALGMASVGDRPRAAVDFLSREDR